MLSQFQWATVVFGMILGISVTRVLSSLVAAFRSRNVASIDWVPVVWSICIFMLQLELWWATSDLRSIIKEWTFPLFLLYTSGPLLLFFAAALILPSHELSNDENHLEIFQRTGRWALIFISIYYLENILVTLYFWKMSLQTTWALLNVTMIILPTLSFFSPRHIFRLTTIIGFFLTLCFVFSDISISEPS